MPVWLIQALMALKNAAIGGPGRAVLTGAAAGIGLADPAGGLLPFSPFGNVFGGGGDQPKRRRRKRLLTQQMKEDISYIAAVMGAPAAKQATLIAVSRS